MIARDLGVRSWMAHAPALVFVTSAYYVSDLYGRGAWPEFVAVSAIPPLAASGARIAQSKRVDLVAGAVFVVAAILFTGSHNITLAWGSVALLAIVGCLRVALARPLFAGRVQMARLLGLLALAIGVNAWFLLPDVLHAADTFIATVSHFSWADTRQYNAPALLFNPLRTVPTNPAGTPALYVQAPVWFMLWSVIAAVVLRTRAARVLTRAGAAFAVVLAAFLVMIMVGPVWQLVPAPLRLIQFALRLNTYVALTAAGLVLIGALAVEHAASPRDARLLKAGLAVAAAASVGLCLWQLWVPNTRATLSYADPRKALVSSDIAPRTWYDGGSFTDGSQRVVNPPAGRVLLIAPGRITGDRVSLVVTPPAGPAPFATNIAGGPYAVKVRGLVRVGRTKNGLTVLRRPNAGSDSVRLTLAAGGAAITIGQLISLLAIVVLSLLWARAIALHLRGRIRRLA